ncbi:hypothetical protein [Mesobacillus maritimus]|uniref:Uncharacterized protein n=1 Tax=Mesobacillus maritimus TaxID=1643336 RepID=A0ABS7K9M3_9BACI|nr:hypothetical protein [Mesobacillus maritimus]MBY0098791.1 hypothetical protein [Mesobacillus maritimus]
MIMALEWACIFIIKIKKNGNKELKRAFYLITFEPDEAINTVIEPPLYWEKHGEKKYVNIKLLNKSKRTSV